MWEGTQSFFVQHPKALGIAGDSVTFAGSLILSLEALFKKAERVSIDRKRKIIALSPYAETSSGTPLSAEAVEAKWLQIWAFASKLGTIVLTFGFLCLLLSRIFAESSK
jgi:hypothetical protein